MPEEVDRPQAPQQADGKPKIIVDEDWKAKDRAEKQRLEAELESGKDAPGQRRGPREVPPASFETLVSTIGTQALLAMGGMEDPQTKRRIVDLDMAKHQIDTLGVLEEKTKGNLTEAESKLLSQVLYQIRMQFVQLAQMAPPTMRPPGAPQPQPPGEEPGQP